jgi:hypothetical protein
MDSFYAKLRAHVTLMTSLFIRTGYWNLVKISRNMRLYRASSWMYSVLLKQTTRAMLLPLGGRAFGLYFTDWSGLVTEELPSESTQRAREWSQLSGSIAIVIQGPLIDFSSFTARVVSFYRRTYPKAILILSTWSNANPAMLGAIARDVDQVILSDLPENAGPRNINLQIVSSAAGILAASRYDVDFVFKTRSDQALLNPYFLPALNELLNDYPAGKGMGSATRIVAFADGTALEKPFYCSDLLVGGSKSDMLSFWDRTESLVSSEISVSNYSNMGSNEQYLCFNFAHRINSELDFDLPSWLFFVRSKLLAVDHEMSGLFWPKYDSTKYFSGTDSQKFSFLQWRSMATNGRASIG